jgi:class 3 adenylate cyclase
MRRVYDGEWLNPRVESQLPAGTVTFLFTDIEGSTDLIRELGDAYGEVLDEHRQILRETLGGAGGREIDTQGDAFFYSFARAREAVRGAVAAQRALGQHEWRDGAELRVRMGLHTGEPTLGAEGYHGLDVVRAARICSAGYGGQILMSETTRALVGADVPDGVEIVDVGPRQLKGLEEERLFQLSLTEAPALQPAPRTNLAPHRSHAELLGDEFSERIDRFVEQQLERSLAGARSLSRPPEPPRQSAAVILAVIFGGAIALVVVLKLAFF